MYKFITDYGNSDPTFIEMHDSNSDQLIGRASYYGNEIRTLEIIRNERNKGHGQALLLETEKQIKNNGYNTCQLLAYPLDFKTNHEQLISFYKKRGYYNSNLIYRILNSESKNYLYKNLSEKFMYKITPDYF